MIFIDFEVFKYDWLCVAIDTETERVQRIHNNKDALLQLYEATVKNIWIGHNIVHYDQYILKGILLGIDPKWVNDKIIKEGYDGYHICRDFKKIPLICYDTFSACPHGLKTLEGFMGRNIKETDVDFDIDRPLTAEEIEQTFFYCETDVKEDMNVFLHNIDEFNASVGLINAFPESLTIYDLYRTKPQLSAKILECEYTEHNDEFNVSVLPCIQLSKYKEAEQFFLNPSNHWYKHGNVKNEYILTIAGVTHKLGWGGIHGAKERFNLTWKSCKMILHIDVASFYPRLMIFHNLLTRNCKHPEKFRKIFEHRLQLKREGKKKEQAPYKIVINATYGICKDKFSPAYDPLQANMICLNGQLMLIDLIEHLEVVPGFELIQSNTDGLIIAIPDTDEAYSQVDDICYEWETRCKMELEFDQIEYIYQKDVNNYLFRFTNGKLERKGSYLKEKTLLDNDLPIVTDALINYFTKGTPISTTINNCNELVKFQKIVKLSANFEKVLHNDTYYTLKCYRVFASKDINDGKIYKCRSGENPKKFGDTPDNCFICNENIENAVVNSKLDKEWYITKALKRLNEFF